MPSGHEEIYSRDDLCLTLGGTEKCIRVKTYDQGKVEQVFHEHIPAYRLSQDSEFEALRSLVAKYSKWSGIFILHSLLNNRRGGPSKFPGMTHHTSYPEEGVLRHTISTGQAWAWSDTVIVKDKFRKKK